MTIIDDDLLGYPAPRAADRPLDPPPTLLGLLAGTPITRVRIEDGRPAWLVTGYEDQRALMADPRVSADTSHPNFPAKTRAAAGGGAKVSFITMDGPEHLRLRRMVTRPFMIKNVQAMRPAIQKITDDLIDKMLAGPRPVDFVSAFALPLPSLVICELLGVPYEDHDFFQETSNQIVAIAPDDPLRPERAMQTLAKFMMELVAKKQAEPGNDVSTELAERVTKGELTLVEAGGIGMLLLFAGHETTANMIALSTVALLEHPEQLALLQQEDNEAVAVTATEELLRYLHITHTGRRRVVLEDIEFAGETMKAGEGLILPNDIANRDPAAFENPNELDIEREAGHHVAFGFGVHQCLGQPLARVELQIVLSTLYRRIPTLRLAAGLDELNFKHDVNVYGVHELPVTW
ncbi:cytochrome P450 [Nocardioides sp. zg-579]|uniref:Cytochrome P450 n=2 Tax=Nocardioides marmotae TaxID=2663857 RepID=A0A6I3J775_9ACTN|nr:cytochrome P450 [Gordonia jinghuaiqii]MTB93729.1 cytochrome P450 [Nocardioides marmotae]QKE03301.1 cytochrome P450 [Nocardioides marmotae]